MCTLARVCQPQDVTLHLKAGSYPVISPENITFPKHFLSGEQRLVEIYDKLFIDIDHFSTYFRIYLSLDIMLGIILWKERIKGDQKKL